MLKIQGKQVQRLAALIANLFNKNAPEAAKLRGRYGSRACALRTSNVDLLSYRHKNPSEP